MNIQMDLGGLAVGMIVVGLVVQAVWLAIGWRAMRAHERIADALESGDLRR